VYVTKQLSKALEGRRAELSVEREVVALQGG
jgi:hypothetical protein